MDEFHFTVEGAIGPESFRVRELSALLEKLEQAIAIESGVRAAEAENQSTIRVLSITRGSFSCAYRALDQFRQGAWKVMEAHLNGEVPRLKPKSIRLLRSFHQKFAEHGAKTFRMSSEAGPERVEAVWPSSRVFPEPGPDQFHYGESDLFVFVIRMGGIKRPTAKVRVLEGNYDTTVELKDMQTALELKPYLYNTAVLRGQARWDRDWDLDRFEVQSVLPPPASAIDAFGAILDRFGGGFDFPHDSDLMRRLSGEPE